MIPRHGYPRPNEWRRAALTGVGFASGVAAAAGMGGTGALVIALAVEWQRPSVSQPIFFEIGVLFPIALWCALGGIAGAWGMIRWSMAVPGRAEIAGRPTLMGLYKSLLNVVFCGLLFAGLGIAIGYLTGVFLPDYPRLFSAGFKETFHPIEIAIGLGLSAGGLVGTAVGVALTAIFAWVHVRRLDREASKR